MHVTAFTVLAVRALVTYPGDEEYAYAVAAHLRGMELPPLAPLFDPQATKDIEEMQQDADAKKTNQDAERCEQNLVEGLLSMGLLPRLRFLLEVKNFPSMSVTFRGRI